LLLPGLFFGALSVARRLLIQFAVLVIIQGLLGLASCSAQRHDAASTTASTRTRIVEGLWIDRDQHYVEFRGWTCLDAGWLEQVACSPGTREHESLVVTDVAASKIHAALLLLGLKPGTPGSWKTEGDEVIAIEPHGPAVLVEVAWTDDRGNSRRCGISQWILDIQERKHYPTDQWIFAGSIELEGEEARRAATTYLADRTGSIIGLVTFGDEVLAAEAVIPDEASVYEPEWVVSKRDVPNPGTPVLVRLVPVRRGQTALE